MFVSSYAVTAQYPNKKPFLVGSFYVEHEKNTPLNEVLALAEEAAERALTEAIRGHFPDECPIPSVLNCRLGALVFVAAQT